MGVRSFAISAPPLWKAIILSKFLKLATGNHEIFVTNAPIGWKSYQVRIDFQGSNLSLLRYATTSIAIDFGTSRPVWLKRVQIEFNQHLANSLQCHTVENWH